VAWSLNAGMELVLWGGSFDDVGTGNGFFVNIKSTYVEYRPGLWKSFFTISSNYFSTREMRPQPDSPLSMKTTPAP
jgi:hypothetical protein